ncbi:UbiH/UbiF/VisC/COQ6 family ubiquinone biosynthesis hydroxylase [Gilvimarinus polysaccharolyticus]|uniref:UbiH/UbiF/VisC/COQ6 family ubiquinone biosynthesis hydroxylase n=1 Tax=Gilvimarinus polysaccharolyticus TaxID=863921 RepID=UPI000673C502|nr:UbiH/UbiF/VisC/COQ6 family ubiquinone biosynthesis hydroxylase [Gilvimarinus polysaccharolyticus]
MANEFDIIIVGAGINGASLALSLSRCLTPQTRIALVAPPPVPHQPEPFDPRVVALTAASQQLLQQLGLWHHIAEQRACPYHDMQVWDGEGLGHIEFSAAELGCDNLGHIVEHRVLNQALEHALTLTQVSRWEQPVTALLRTEQQRCSGVELASGETLSAALTIAADGAQSPLRQLAGFNERQWSYQQSAIVATVRCEANHDGVARQRFMRTGPLALLPLIDTPEASNGQHCSIVWSADQAFADILMALDDAAFCQTLERHFERRLGAIEHVSQRHAFALHQRHATAYVQPGLALIGDAAHSIHPLAGQGVNLGLLDVACLSDELQRAQSRGVSMAEHATLRRYERQRMGHNLTMMAAMESFKRLFGTRQPSLTLLRNRALNGVNNLPALKNLLAQQAMGLSL